MRTNVPNLNSALKGNSENSYNPNSCDSDIVTIFNILRTNPMDPNMDFSSYAGLPGSIFSAMQKISGLEECLSGYNNDPQQIYSSTQDKREKHLLIPSAKNGIASLVANGHNIFTGQSDLSFYGEAPIRDSSGMPFYISFVAKECYREKGEGERHPIWELGVSITHPSTKGRLHEERLVIEIPASQARPQLLGPISSFMESLNKKIYDISWNSDSPIDSPNDCKYLNEIIEKTEDIRIIPPQEFGLIKDKLFRYAHGTLDIKQSIKIEDRSYSPPKKYRVLLLSTLGIPKKKQGSYIVEKIENMDTTHSPVYSSYADALKYFNNDCRILLRKLYHDAGKNEEHCKRNIPLRPTPGRVDYVTVIEDVNENQITVISGKTLEGGYFVKLLEDPRKHCIYLLDKCSNITPRTIMDNLISNIKQTVFNKDNYIFTNRKDDLRYLRLAA